MFIMGELVEGQNNNNAEEQNLEPVAHEEQDPPETDSLEWVLRFVSHVVGGSMLVLPFAMSQAGIFYYMLILGIEVYFIFQSFVYLCEMVAEQHRIFGMENINYFAIVENCFQGSVKYVIRAFIRVLYFFDVVICTAYYFKIFWELTESFLFVEPIPENLRQGYFAAAFIGLSCFLIVFEHAEKFVVGRSHISKSQSSISIGHSIVDNINVTQGVESDLKDPPINMEAVVKETHTYNWKRSILLFFFMCFAAVVFSICLSIWQDPDVMFARNITSQCPGIMQPTKLWISLDFNIFYVIPTVIFGLMNYAILLPICVTELTLPRGKYVSLIDKSRLTIFIVYTLIPFLVVSALGDSVPVLFPAAFGYTIYGKLITFVAIMLTLTGMLLRVIACCKLIQVLFCDTGSNTRARYWLIVILLFFTSFVISSVVPSAIHLVIVAGSINCNLLLIIIPRVAYMKFKMNRLRFRFQVNSLTDLYLILAEWIPIIVGVFIGIVIHIVFLLTTFKALQIVDPHVGNLCRGFFNQYWGFINDTISLSPETCRLV